MVVDPIVCSSSTVHEPFVRVSDLVGGGASLPLSARLLGKQRRSTSSSTSSITSSHPSLQTAVTPSLMAAFPVAAVSARTRPLHCSFARRSFITTAAAESFRSSSPPPSSSSWSSRCTSCWWSVLKGQRGRQQRLLGTSIRQSSTVLSIPLVRAAAYPKVGAELLALLQRVGQVRPQRLGEEERREAAGHGQRAHDHQGEHVAVAALKEFSETWKSFTNVNGVSVIR